MTVGSLFAGIGGIDLAFMQAGFQISWAIENSPSSCETYRSNFKDVSLIEEDIRCVNPTCLPPVDILVAGFPCQAFSIGGKQQGFQDRRGNLFFEVIRFIEAILPPVVFLENVANLVQHDSGHTFHVIYNTLVEHGYYVRYRILRASEYGSVPQIRDRIYIVALKSLDACERFRFPDPVALKVTSEAIVDRSKVVRDSYYYKDNGSFAKKARKIVTDPNAIYRVYHSSIKPIKGGLCPTLTAAMGKQSNQVPLICDFTGVRKLTPRECLKFQGFPENFGFPDTVSQEKRYEQIGNSVCVPVVRRIAKRIREVLVHN